MNEQVVILGAGGHARSVIDVIRSQNQYEIAGCVAQISQDLAGVPGVPEVPILGDDSILPALRQKGFSYIFVAIGNNRIRAKLYKKVCEMGFHPVNAISPHAYLSPTVQLGRGICVMPGAVLGINTVVGDNAIINTRCSVDHDCSIAAHVHLAPGVTLSGTVTVGAGTQLGTGASVIDGMTIGEWSMVGAGSVVVREISSHVMAYGVPARVVKEI